MSSLDRTLEQLVREVMPRRLHKLALEGRMTLSGDLAIESIGLMSLAFRFEEEFQIDLMAHAEQVSKVRTVDDLRELIRQFGGRGS